jgi:hypothetical protein
MHDAGHERVHGTDVGEVTFAVKSVLALVVGIQTLRGKTLVAAGDGMRRPGSMCSLDAPSGDGEKAGISLYQRERNLFRVYWLPDSSEGRT